MGLGFSPNDDMGDEAVVISHADGHADTYWNVDTPVQYALPTGDEGVARPVTTVSADGTFYSSYDLDQLFNVRNPTTGNLETTDLVGEMYYLLLAVGEMDEASLVPEAGEVPQKHFLKFASLNPILFASTTTPSTSIKHD